MGVIRGGVRRGDVSHLEDWWVSRGGFAMGSFGRDGSGWSGFATDGCYQEGSGVLQGWLLAKVDVCRGSY